MDNAFLKDACKRQTDAVPRIGRGRVVASFKYLTILQTWATYSVRMFVGEVRKYHLKQRLQDF
jgi:hypothetical protein